MNKVTFDLTLFNNDSVREKLKVMGALEAMVDDENNKIPDDYWGIIEVKLGETIRITVEKL